MILGTRCMGALQFPEAAQAATVQELSAGQSLTMEHH